ncbi:DUF4166 domain-containing protein [Natronomonas sp.]|uniref:DUF4166 domain-containing protein n=1 Tax=Natronomonas sp. TaxID=2184060 RepID=UPI002FC2F491
MTGVYEHALGSAAEDLHPKVRDRYSIGPDDSAATVGHGEMDIRRGTPFLPMLYVMPARNLLFPESGDDVPFSVTTVGYRDEAGHEVMTTRREFDFGSTRRRFDSLTVWDADAGRLLDFLGTGGHVVSELHPRVEDGALVVEGGRQWVRARGRYLPIPGPLGATVEVRDRYDETAECYHVDAVVDTFAGRVLSYRGMFTQERESMDEVPEDLRPTRDLSTLPPE